jgi:hypothetical protein
MKYFLVMIPVVIFLSACNKTGKQLKKKIVNADSVAINYFKGDGTMDTVVAVRIVRDKKVIEQLTGFVTNGSNQQTKKCGFDGSLHFFKMNKVVQDIEFRMGDECSQFYFVLLGQHHAGGLDGDAKKLLLDLKK